ncbi:hypothetical protein GEMRC1_010834 [Eukaryota sp. GEM-RC1]
MKHTIHLLKAEGDYVIRIDAGDTIVFDHPTEVTLQTEYPFKDHRSFRRGVLYQFPPFRSSFSGYSFCLDCRLPGTFSCVFGLPTRSFDLRIIVQPQLHVPINCLMIQTLITKLIGPVHEWTQHFTAAKAAGFNMIHLTPVQPLGGSNSSYCIKEHTKLSPLLFPSTSNTSRNIDGLKSFLLDAKHKLNLRFTIDMIYNHAASDSDWLVDHPECLYNLDNSAHLTSAFVLDEVIMRASGAGLPDDVDVTWRKVINPTLLSYHCVDLVELRLFRNHCDVQHVIEILKKDCIPKAKIWEFYVINKGKTLSQIQNRLENSLNAASAQRFDPQQNHHHIINQLEVKQVIINSNSGQRDPISFNICKYLQIIKVNEYVGVHPLDIELILTFSNKIIDILNVPHYKEFDTDILSALAAVTGALRYKHLEDHGPKIRHPVSPQHPLVDPLFTRIPHPSGLFIPVANNGWVMGHKPASQPDFVSPTSKSYIRREVIVWGDNVKLRYGRKKSDSPFLWNLMSTYTKQMAGMFDGIRLDNCHSTPIHVAEYFLDIARKVNSNLFIFAELFTGSLDADLRFVRSLGINALIREGSRADDHSSLSRTLWECAAADPVGSICPTEHRHMRMNNMLALLYDCTHDNEPPSLTRTPHDTLPTMALVACVPCPVGSVKGYDDLVPHRICVVEEARMYLAEPEVSLSPVRSFFSMLRMKLARDGFSEFHVSSHDSGTIVVHRHSPRTFSSMFVIARTAFKFGPCNKSFEITLPGVVSRCRFFATLDVPEDVVVNFERDSDYITGLSGDVFYNSSEKIPKGVKIKHFDLQSRSERSVLSFSNFPPGSVLVLEGVPSLVSQLSSTTELSPMKILDPPSLPTSLLASLTFQDLHELLYVSGPEFHKEMYWIPAFHHLPYAGVAGWMAVLQQAKNSGSPGHPVLEHLRAGTWAADYLVDYLKSTLKFVVLFRNTSN